MPLVIAEFISATAILYAIIPCVYFVAHPTLPTGGWVIAVLAAPFLVKLLKSYTIQYPYSEFRRPEGARNCNVLMNNGDQTGAPGFPSGHCATATAFWVGAWMLADGGSGTLIAIVGSMGILSMAWARMQMRCHSGLQTIAGTMFGAVLGCGAVAAAGAIAA
jgi:membrane-associated phospholipid phosphatase